MDRGIRDAAGTKGDVALCVYTRAWTSGSGLFIREIVDALVDLGAQVTFVSPLVDAPAFEAPRPGLRRIRPMRELSGGHGIRRALRSLGRIAGAAAGLLRARVSNRVFIVSIPDPLVFSIPMLALLRLSGARIIFVAHDPVPHAWSLASRWRWLERAAHGACYHLASSVIVLSVPSRAKLQEVFPAVATPVEVIDHGVFVMGDPVAPPARGALLAFGTIRRNKCTLEAIGGVIAAHAAGADIRLLVAGEAHREDRAYADECLALARSAPGVVEMRIAFVDDADLPALIGACDALLMPYSTFFSQSGVALLAASNARPVIATDVGGIGTLLDEGMPAIRIAGEPTAAAVEKAVLAFAATPSPVWHDRALDYRRFTLERRAWPVVSARYLALARRLDR